jgi:glycosyltransferase involved in cell wall biosynthesis
MLAPYFPPIGGAGVQRNVQLASRLPGHGYAPLVLTGPSAPDYRWTPADESLAASVVDTAVYRLPGPEPPHASRWEARAERWLRAPTRWQGWWQAGVESIAERVGPVDLVHASLRPYSTAETARMVARRLRVPLVVDLEDPWALDEMMVYPSAAHRRLELASMRRTLLEADAVVMNTREAARRVSSLLAGWHGRVVAIPNAFEPDAGVTAAPRTDGCFRIVHTGSMHLDSGLAQRRSAVRRALGGVIDGVDFLPRSHVHLAEALDRLFRARPDLCDSVELHLAGVLTDAERSALRRLPYAKLHGFLPHRETQRLIASADLLFLPMHEVPAGRRATIVPHKTYEYLASGRPILAAVPDGDARDLLEAAGTADVCCPTDVAAMFRALERAIERWVSGASASPGRPDVVAACGAERLVAQMATLYADVLSRAALARLASDGRGGLAPEPRSNGSAKQRGGVDERGAAEDVDRARVAGSAGSRAG